MMHGTQFADDNLPTANHQRNQSHDPEQAVYSKVKSEFLIWGGDIRSRPPLNPDS
jgi:hypothetical protein